MAIAKICDGEVQENGDTLYEVFIEDYSRYTGPPGTEWQLVDSSSYQFRTSADEVAEMVEAVRAGKTTIQAACKASQTFKDVIDRQLEIDEEYGDAPSGTPDERRLHCCKEFDIDSLFISLLDDNPYWTVEDEFNPQAVEALDYPDWASGELGDGADMDRDYTPGFIRIEKGHDLAELWQWLEKRQAERSTPTKEKSRQGRRKAK